VDETPLDGNPTCDLRVPVEPLLSFSGKISPKIQIKKSKKKRIKRFSVAKS
jgi:hypothetical protein